MADAVIEAHCPVYFSETKNTLMEGLKTPVSVIWHVLKARTEGMGLNAAARTFEKAKNTILAWERKFLDLHQMLFLYALVHEFLELVIEGDEAYTKVGCLKNTILKPRSLTGFWIQDVKAVSVLPGGSAFSRPCSLPGLGNGGPWHSS